MQKLPPQFCATEKLPNCQESEEKAILRSTQDFLAQIATQQFGISKDHETIIYAHASTFLGVVLFRHLQIHIDFGTSSKSENKQNPKNPDPSLD